MEESQKVLYFNTLNTLFNDVWTKESCKLSASPTAEEVFLGLWEVKTLILMIRQLMILAMLWKAIASNFWLLHIGLKTSYQINSLISWEIIKKKSQCWIIISASLENEMGQQSGAPSLFQKLGSQRCVITKRSDGETWEATQGVQWPWWHLQYKQSQVHSWYLGCSIS